MKPTPVPVQVTKRRLPAGQAERQQATILIDLTDTRDGECAGVVSLEKGSTGCESFRVSNDLSELERAARGGWTACAGTPGSYPEAIVPAAEMGKVLAQFRALQRTFAAGPGPVIRVYVATAEEDDVAVTCALLYAEASKFWKAFTSTAPDRGDASEARTDLEAVLFAVGQLRTPARLHVVGLSEYVAAGLDEVTDRPRLGDDKLPGLWDRLDAEWKWHALESAERAPENLLVRSCRQAARVAVGERQPFRRAQLLVRLRAILEEKAQALYDTELSIGTAALDGEARARLTQTQAAA